MGTFVRKPDDCSSVTARCFFSRAHDVFRAPASRSSSFTLSTAKGQPVLPLVYRNSRLREHESVRTSDFLANLDYLRKSHPISSDSTNFGPLAIKIDSPGHHRSKVGGGGQGYDRVFMAVDRNCAAVLEVKNSIQRVDVSRRSIGRRQIV